MKKVSIAVVLLSFFFCCMIIYVGYAQVTSASKGVETKTKDVNNDGKPDVTHYSSDGKYIEKTEMDTNGDGKPDVVVYNKDGKFESAEIDTDYDGEMDKKVTEQSALTKWMNESHSDFKDEFNKQDWEFGAIKF